jgi:hypothetical protein
MPWLRSISVTSPGLLQFGLSAPRGSHLAGRERSQGEST